MTWAAVLTTAFGSYKCDQRQYDIYVIKLILNFHTLLQYNLTHMAMYELPPSQSAWPARPNFFGGKDI